MVQQSVRGGGTVIYWEDGIDKRTIYTGRKDCTYWEDDIDKRTARTGKMTLTKGLYVLGGMTCVLGGWH